MSNTEVVVFDLDSTLADTTHRQWMIPEILKRPGGEPGLDEHPNWEDYSMACADDLPIAGTIALTALMEEAGCEVVIVTGRSSAAAELTEKWLAKHGVMYGELIMRPAGDRTPNAKFKVAIIGRLRTEGTVRLVVEDFPEAADAIRAAYPDVPVLLVNPGSWDGPGGV